jgi:hypothetical protein
MHVTIVSRCPVEHGDGVNQRGAVRTGDLLIKVLFSALGKWVNDLWMTWLASPDSRQLNF